MAGGDVRPLHTVVEAKFAEIGLEVMEGSGGEQRMPVLIQDFRLKISIRDICDAIVHFQREFDRVAENRSSDQPQWASRSGEPPQLVYGEPGVNAPPPPQTLPPRLPRAPPEPHSWESDILALQPGWQLYADRTGLNRDHATWHLIDEGCMTNFVPVPPVRYVPVKI